MWPRVGSFGGAVGRDWLCFVICEGEGAEFDRVGFVRWL